MSRSSVTRSWPLLMVAIAAIVALLALVFVPRPTDENLLARGGQKSPPASPAPSAAASPVDTDADADADADEDEDPNEEAEEQREGTEHRLETLAKAKDAGKAGQRKPAPDPNAAPAPGWAGEVPIELGANASDDWEPAIAADPGAPYVYALVTRYGAGKPCNGNCPVPYIALFTSTNGGGTWSAGRPLCACKGSGQFDPIIEVVPNNGAVYASYMNGFNIMFTKSTDHGATWSAPVPVYGNVSWNDKPTLAVSDDGVDVYIGFNGPTGGDPWMAQSHNRGASWTQTKLVDSARYYFTFDTDVAPDGTVYSAQSALLYGGGGNKGSFPTGTVDEHVFISRDKGAHWEDKLVAQVQPGVACLASAGCTPDFYLGHTALAVDSANKVVLLYDGAATARGLQTIRANRSSDGGVTWSAPVVISATSEEATDPAMEARGSSDFRAWYVQTSGGGNPDQWNVWYRTSSDGGATWSTPVNLSNAATGAGYKTAAGFGEPYGDYGETAITSAGKTVAIWGEGFSYDGPGGVWVNRQP